MSLRIRVLGGLELRRGDTVLPALESARAESLLAYLVVHRGTPQPRQKLAFLLWPDSTEPQARTNLRHVLHNLRRALPDAEAWLEVTPRTLRVREDVDCDLRDFEDALARGDPGAAVEAYGGDLLAGAYDEWLLEERERLRELQIGALEALDGLEHAERLLRLDPLRESTYRRLMALHDARGDRARALRTYHACAAVLERDLGIEPGPATRAAYEALLPGAPESESSGRAPLVGRAPERARLAERWRDARAGRAQLVLVTGEAGIGKTRLVEELRASVAGDGSRGAVAPGGGDGSRGAVAPAGGDGSRGAVAPAGGDGSRGAVAPGGGDGSRGAVVPAGGVASRAAVTAEGRSYPAEGTLAYGPVASWLRAEPLAARRAHADLAQLARVLPELPATDAPEDRARLLEALAHALIVTGGPLLLVADDLHWADEETLQFVHYLIRGRPDAPLLVAATARSEDLAPLEPLVAGLTALDRCTRIELAPLSRQETAVLAERLGGEADPDALFAGTEGNPLFVVETLRAGALSPRVQAVIAARLAQLSPAARELAGVAATVGREFSADVLAHGADEAALVPALDDLWRRRIVRERGPDGYDFSHDKLREVAYAALPPAQRRRNHLRVARALAALRPEEPGEVALHFDRAGAPEAAAWYERAGAAELRRYANADAIRALERALALGADEPRVIEALVPPLSVVEGWGAPRLAELLERVPEPGPALLTSHALVALSRSDFAAARRWGERLEGDDAIQVERDYVLGIAAFWQGELDTARTHFEAAVARYAPENRGTHILRFGLDPRVVCKSRLANTLGFLGDADGARRTRAQALAFAAETGHAPSTATALVFAALLALDLGDDVRALTAELAASSRDVRSAAVVAEAFLGYADVLDGRPGGVARARRALAAAPDPEHAPGHTACVARVLLAAATAAGDENAAEEAAGRLRNARAGAKLWAGERLRNGAFG